jgi:integrase
MARSTTAITTAWMDRAQPEGLHWCRKSTGLGCRVGKTGTKAWVFQKGSGRRVTLGRWPAMDVATARLEAAKMGASRTLPRSGTTLRDAMDARTARLRLDRRSEQTIHHCELMMNKHVSDLLDRPLREITRGQLGRLHESIGAEHGTAAANNVLRNLRAIHNHAMARDDGLGLWPGRGVRLFPDNERDEIVEDLPAWRAKLDRCESPVVRDWWLFVLYTGLRRADALSAQHSLVRDGVLHLPNPKGGERRAFDLPLSTQALEIIGRQAKVNDWIFPGQIEGRHLTTGKVPTTRALPGPHTLRRTWATHAELIGCPRAITSRLLNHTGKRDVTSRYIKPDRAVCALRAQRVADRIEELSTSR